MKKLYFILFFLISSFLSYGQKYFVGGHGNNEWSNASNWSNGKPNALNAVVTTTTDVTCFGDCDGELLITAAGGTPPYTYLWNDPAAQTTNNPTGLCPGV